MNGFGLVFESCWIEDIEGRLCVGWPTFLRMTKSYIQLYGRWVMGGVQKRECLLSARHRSMESSQFPGLTVVTASRSSWCCRHIWRTRWCRSSWPCSLSPPRPRCASGQRLGPRNRRGRGWHPRSGQKEVGERAKHLTDNNEHSLDGYRTVFSPSWRIFPNKTLFGLRVKHRNEHNMLDHNNIFIGHLMA